MTQLYEAIAKKTDILAGCINRSTVSEPHGEMLLLYSVRPQLFASIFGHWKAVSIFGSIGGSPEESNKNDQQSGECDLQGKMESCLD